MTISEFMDNLSDHGVEDNLHYGLFITYLNTALFKIYNDVIIPKKGRLFSPGTRPTKIYDDIYHHGDVDKNIELEGAAFSLRIYGNSTYILLTTGGETKMLAPKGDDNVVKSLLVDRKGTLSLLGKNSYSICDLCIFDDLPTQVAHSLPDGLPTTEYIMSEKYVDFASFLSPPVDRFGNRIEEVKTVDDRLIVGSYYRGDIIFTYRRRPILTNPNYDDDIDIPEKYECLLTPLLLYLYYIDVDDDKANAYMQAYKLLLENIVYPTNNASIECDNVVTNGW